MILQFNKNQGNKLFLKKQNIYTPTQRKTTHVSKETIPNEIYNLFILHICSGGIIIKC